MISMTKCKDCESIFILAHRQGQVRIFSVFASVFFSRITCSSVGIHRSIFVLFSFALTDEANCHIFSEKIWCFLLESTDIFFTFVCVWESCCNICFIFKRSTRGKLILSEMKNSGTVTHPCIFAFNLFHPPNQTCLGGDGSSTKKSRRCIGCVKYLLQFCSLQI